MQRQIDRDSVWARELRIVNGAETIAYNPLRELTPWYARSTSPRALLDCRKIPIALVAQRIEQPPPKR